MKNIGNDIINDLERFIGKYYFNKLVVGIVLTFLIFLLYSTTLIIIEHSSYLSIPLKTIIFYGTILIFLCLISYFVIFPFLKIFKIGKVISIKDIAVIISSHFVQIKDKLINIIELIEENGVGNHNNLIEASVDQKYKELEPFQFKEAFKLRFKKEFIVLIVVALIVPLSFLALMPNDFIAGTNRLLDYKTEYISEAKFTFKIENDDFVVKRGSDYEIKVSLTGKKLPGSVFLEIGNEKLLMEKLEDDSFSYTIRNLYNSVAFRFTDDIHYSDYFKINVLPVPTVIDYKVTTKPPNYTGIEAETISNNGNLIVPVGTLLKWSVKTVDTDSFKIVEGNNNLVFEKSSEDYFELDFIAKKNINYTFEYKNRHFNENGGIGYFIQTIEDEFPSIKISSVVDSSNYNIVYFKGKISDDYGFSKLNYRVISEDVDTVIPISFNKNTIESDFYYAFDFSLLDQSDFQYYFEIFDNDYINGYKSSQSKYFSFNYLDYADIDSIENVKIDNLEKLINNSRELSEDIRYQLNEFKKSQINSELTEWQKKMKLNEIQKKQKELEETIEKIKSQNSNLNNFRNSFSENSLDLIRKQEELENLVDEIFSDEIKDLMDKLNELANEFDEKKFNEFKSKLEFNLKDFEKQLDRNLSMLRRLHIEKKLQLLSENLDNIVEKQENISESLKKKKLEIDKAVDKINKEKEGFEKANDELDEIIKNNSELKSPFKLDNTDSLINNINSSYKDVLEELKSGSRNRTSKKIKDSNKKISDLANSLRKSLQKCNVSMKMESLDNLTNILTNLVSFSFEQEDVLRSMKNISSNNPDLVKIISNQNNLNELKKSFSDSLYSIAERTPQVGNKVFSELLSMDYELDRAKNYLENGEYGRTRVSQQLVINSVNTVALFIDEIIDTINDLMENAVPCGSDGKCNLNKPKFGSIISSQEALKRQLEEMIKQMESGGKFGEEQVGKLLMQQEMIKSLINDLMNNGGLGNESFEELKNAKNLIEQNISDFVNNNVNRTTVLRQNSIFKHLLDAENAEMQRGLDEEREAVAAKRVSDREVKLFFNDNSDSLKVGSGKIELSPIRMNNFYKKKYKSYKVLIDE